MSDLISKKEVKAILDKLHEELFDNGVEFKKLRPITNAMIKIDILPSAERHGQWFDVGSLSCRCNMCGCKNGKETTYCPNCGAKMEGKEEEHGKMAEK